ncbi:hypothetical protein AT1219_40275 [Vibrio alginolyticus]
MLRFFPLMSIYQLVITLFSFIPMIQGEENEGHPTSRSDGCSTQRQLPSSSL